MKSKPNNKHLIVSLIKDDLVHTQLIKGLQGLELNLERYTLRLGPTIISLMGFKGEEAEYLLTYYRDLQQRVTMIGTDDDHTRIKDLARDIYHHLLLQKPLETGI